MEKFNYLIENFFTHKDYLAPASEILGTLYTPLFFIFIFCLLGVILLSAVYVAKHKELIKPVFKTELFLLVIWEFAIVAWDSLAGKNVGFDFTTNLSLYPCSIFLYAMPFVIWGKGIAKKSACGYVCTLGLLGAAVNFIYPMKLIDYSCISFAGFHTMFYHGAMLFTCLVILISNYHTYTDVRHWWELFLPCIPTLIMSIPANIVNYSPVNADYMYFRGRFFLLEMIFSGVSDITVTAVLYMLYIFVPALFYLPSFIAGKRKEVKCKNPEVFVQIV